MHVSAVGCSIEIVEKNHPSPSDSKQGRQYKMGGCKDFPRGAGTCPGIRSLFILPPFLLYPNYGTLKTTPLWFVSAIVSTLKKERNWCWMRVRRLRVIFFCTVVTKWRGLGEGINQYCSIFVLSGVWGWRGMKRAEGAFLLFTSPKKQEKDAMRARDPVTANVALGSRTSPPHPLRPPHRFRCFILKRNINAH